METQVQEKVIGMGAILQEKGVFFRVWAPHADAVYVAGDFNDWEQEKHELEQEGNGYWGGLVTGAKAGEEYKFFLKTPFGEFFRNDPYARSLTNSDGNSIIVDPSYDWEGTEEFRIAPWPELVIYELHIGTFNVEEEGRPGTFASTAKKMGYLKELGINAIEIMPVAEFPGGFSWGYNPAHPFAIEADYGGPKALKDLVKTAHQHGIAVIMDVVYNHFGPSDMDLWQFDGWQENDKGGIYFYNDWRCETPWGDTRPDYGREEVRRYIHDNALMWLEEYQVDGLRMDMVPYIRNVRADGNPDSDLQEGLELIKWINGDIREKYPWKFTVAEDMHGLDFITSPIEHGGLSYSSQWDSEFVHPIRKVLIEQNDEHRDMLAVEQALQHNYNGDPFQRVIYTESHDEVSNGQARVAEEIAADGEVNNWFSKRRSALGSLLVMTAPGIPMLFQGQELLEDKWFSDQDPIDWSHFKEFRGVVRLHQDLIRLRRNFAGNARGLSGRHIDILHLNNEQKTLAYHRWHEGGAGDSVVVVLNLSNEAREVAINFPSAGVWEVVFNSDAAVYGEEYGNAHFPGLEFTNEQLESGAATAMLSLPSYGAVIYAMSK